MKCLICITTKANIDNLKKNILSYKQYALNYEIKIIIVDQFADNQPIEIINNCEIFYAYEIFSKDFYKHAFTFTQEEFIDYVTLVSAKYFLEKGYQNILVTNSSVKLMTSVDSFKEYNSLLQDSIFLLQSPINNSTIDENTKSTILSDTEMRKLLSFIFINNGSTVISFIDWCIRQYEHLYFVSWAHYLMYDEETRKIIRHNHQMCYLSNILASNLHYLDICNPIYHWENSFEIIKQNPHYEFDYFRDGTPIHYLIKDMLSTPYTIGSLIGSNPFQEKDLFMKQSVFFENKQTLPITSTMQKIYEKRTDLQVTFKNHLTSDRKFFCEWFVNNASKEYELNDSYIQPVRDVLAKYNKNLLVNSYRLTKLMTTLKNNVRIPKKYPFGVNLCGYIRGAFGLAEATRLLAKTLDESGIPFTIISYTGSPFNSIRNNTDWEHKISNEFKYSVNIVLGGGVGEMDFITVTNPEMYRDRYNIGYLYWELPEYYPEWSYLFNYIDEVWTSCDFCKKAFETQTNKPVKIMPLTMNVPVDKGCDRKYFGLPEDKFIFLMMYDVRSIQERKNPKAAIYSFINEFKENENAVLVIKIGAPKNWNGENELLNKIKHLKNIIIINETFKKPVVNALINCCDVYVSLHRSEGLGLGPAEAMYLGKPAVMTGWSGNMIYATKENSCLVDYKIIEVDKDYPPYKKGCHWADADVKDASKYMRKLFEDKDYYNQIATNGYKTMHEDFDAKVLGKKMEERLKEVQSKISDSVYKNLTH